MEKMNDLKDLLKHEIDDLFSVEEQIIEALPKMIDNATNKTLKTALTEHLRITREHKTRLEKIQAKLSKGSEEGEKKKGFLAGIFGGGKHVCKGMQGIIEEGNKIMSADMTPEVMDAAIIACAQKVEHYEICGYGTARTYARELEMEQEARLLEKTLNEEYEADDKLTQLAVQRINLEAETGTGMSGDHTGSGSTKNRTGRDTARERVRAEEEQLQPASGRRGESESRARSTSASGSPRSSSSGRSATSKSTRSSSGNGKTTKASAKSSGRSSSSRSR
jgi:ferritin-like metal-binding protein YciE